MGELPAAFSIHFLALAGLEFSAQRTRLVPFLLFFSDSRAPDLLARGGSSHAGPLSASRAPALAGEQVARFRSVHTRRPRQLCNSGVRRFSLSLARRGRGL